jgi:hypothetical protein
LSLKKPGAIYYRIVWRKQQGDSSVSPIRKLMLPNALENFTIYPNPGRSIPIISAMLSDNSPVTLLVFGMDGKLLIQQQLIPQGQRLQTLLPEKAASLPSGLYLIKLQSATTQLQGNWLKL